MNIQDTSWLETMKSNVNGDSWVASWIKNYVDGNIEGALESINKSDLDIFGDAISVMLGETDEGELLKNKAESYRQFFEAVHNYFGKDGDYSAEELATLENIKNAYKATNEEAKKYQDSLEAQTSLQGYLSQFEESDWEREQEQTFSLMGVSGDDMSVWIKYEKIIKDVREQFAKLAKGEMVEYNGQLYDEERMIDAVTEARRKELEAMQKEEQELFNLSKTISEGMFGGKYKDTGFMQGFAGAIAGSTGGQIVEAGIQGASAGGAEGAILGILTEILTQTEAFQEILNILDPVVDTFNNFLKPIVPLVQIISSLINQLVFTLLKPLFPILKDVFSIIGELAKPVKVVLNIIHNIYAVVNNIWQRLTHPFTGGDRMGYVALEDGLDEIEDAVTAIKNMTFDIKENTDPKNSELLKAYNNMFRNGMITASEYQGLLNDMNGLNYDNMRTYQGGAWNNGRGGTTIVYNGDMHFTIDGTNLSAEEIAEAVTRKQIEWATTGQYA